METTRLNRSNLSIADRFRPRAMLSLSQYLRYAAVALAALITTVLVRELVQIIVGADTKITYGASIIFAYAVGIVVNFSLQKRFTFRMVQDGNDTEAFIGFVIVALVGAAATFLVAFALRYGLGLDLLMGSGAPTIAFLGATVLSSFLTYALNARYVFSGNYNSL